MLLPTTKGGILVVLAFVFVYVFAWRWAVTPRITIPFPWRLREPLGLYFQFKRASKQYKFKTKIIISLISVECNYGVGKWVPENNTRPIYSGLHCRRWLSGTMNCRLMPRRNDFSYEWFRWKPDNCALPEFDHRVFLERHAIFFYENTFNSVGIFQKTI